MTPERWKKVEEVFLAALEQGERPEFLDEACAGDELLVEEVRSLLSAHDLVTMGFLEAHGELPAACAPGGRIGPYRLLAKLGRGGQGRVYLAQDTRLPRNVALKLLTEGFDGSPRKLHRFRREAAAASRLDHPGICTVYEAGEADGTHYIAMRYVAGRTLAEEIDAARAGHASDNEMEAAPDAGAGPARAGLPSADAGSGLPRLPTRVEVRRAVRLIERAARALHAAHEAGLVHRDIKPSNIIVTRQGDPVILDFGIVRDQEDGEGSAGTLTVPGDILGTPAYMSAEQLEPSRAPLDRRTDIYSLGATLYECLTLRRPFDAPTREGLYKKILTADPPDPRRFNPVLTSDLRAILATALEKDRDRRYETAADLGDDLGRFLAGEPIRARPAGVWASGLKWARRRPAAAGLVAVSVAALLSFLLVGTWFMLELQEHYRIRRYDLYAAHTNLAHAAWRDGDIARVLKILDSDTTRPDPVAREPEDLRGWEWYYLRGLTRKDLVTLKPAGYRAYVSVAWSPCGRWLAAGSRGSHADLWDLKNPGGLRTFVEPEGTVHTVAFSPDSATLATGGESGEIRIRVVDTGELVRRLRDPRGLPVHGVAFRPDGGALAAASYDTVKLWDPRSGREIRELKGDGSLVYSVSFSADGRFVASGGQDARVHLWDLDSGNEIRTFAGHSAPINTVVFSPDGKRLATGSDDRTVRLWNAATGHEVCAPHEYSRLTYAGGFSPDGSYFVSASQDCSLRIRDVRSGRELKTLIGHSAMTTSAVFSPSGRWIASAGMDGAVKIWDVTRDHQDASIHSFPSVSGQAAFSQDGRTLACGNGQGLIALWDTARMRRKALLSGHTAAVSGMTFLRNDRALVSTGHDGTVRIWDIDGGKELRALRGHAGAVLAIAASPDGSLVATADSDRSVKVWDPDNWLALRALNGHSEVIQGVAFSMDSRVLAGGAGDGTVHLWDPASGRPIRAWQGHAQRIVWLAFSPVNARLASAGKDALVKIWDSESGRELATLSGHSSRVGGAAFSPDGRRLATGGDLMLKLWDTASWQETLSLIGHTWPLESVVFSPDGRLLASTAADGTLRFWPAPREAPTIAEAFALVMSAVDPSGR